jgi:hypothetical protein
MTLRNTCSGPVLLYLQRSPPASFGDAPPTAEYATVTIPARREVSIDLTGFATAGMSYGRCAAR